MTGQKDVREHHQENLELISFFRQVTSASFGPQTEE